MARVLMAVLACAVLAVSAGAASRGARDDGKQALSYGADRLQAVDYWAAPSTDAPLVVFVHGGGWSRGDKRMMDGSDKLAHWRAQGYAVASVNYRLVPEATVEEQAADVAAAVAHLKARSGALGFDPERIALVGHSAGAHLVALVGTDPAYLRGVGLSFADIDGVGGIRALPAGEFDERGGLVAGSGGFKHGGAVRPSIDRRQADDEKAEEKEKAREAIRPEQPERTGPVVQIHACDLARQMGGRGHERQESDPVRPDLPYGSPPACQRQHRSQRPSGTQ